MKVRMSVARCCCAQPFCSTVLETNYTDDFSSSDPGWSFASGVSVSGGVATVTMPTTGSGGSSARNSTFDFAVKSNRVTKVNVNFNGTDNITAGVSCFPTLRFIARPSIGDFLYSYSGGSGTVSQTPSSGDLVEIDATFTSYSTGTVTFSVEFLINSVVKATVTHNQTVTDQGRLCAVNHGFNCSRGDSGTYTVSFDNYELATT